MSLRHTQTRGAPASTRTSLPGVFSTAQGAAAAEASPPGGKATSSSTTSSTASSRTEEIDPRTLGVPGLKTVISGDRVEILWRHGARTKRTAPAPARPRSTVLRDAPRRAGWERGRVTECVLEMRKDVPVIIYRITYDDGEKAPPPPSPRTSHPSVGPG